MSISVKNVSKTFNNSFVALNNVSLDINPGELVALLGPSGSGKTTLLRIISGMEFADVGKIIIDGEEAHKKSAKERNVGFVFQHYALFKHMTVFDNVAFGLRVRKKKDRPSESVIQEKVMSLLKLVHLDAFHDRYPSQLSGGQRQRVALARALAVEPKVLLLDEPFGALDAKVRKELRRWMRKLHDDIHITSVFVTHDQEEAMEVADKVVVMSNGRIEQVGTPDEVYHNPANSFVYDFLGNYNEFKGYRDEEGNIHIEDHEVSKTAKKKIAKDIVEKPKNILDFITDKIGLKKSDVAPIKVDPRPADEPKSKDLTKGALKIFCRPHELFITKDSSKLEEYLKARIVYINSAGPLVKIEMEDKSGRVLFAEVPKTVLEQESLQKDDNVFIWPIKRKIFKVKQ